MWPYMAPKGTQFEPKGYQHDPKGYQKDAKSEPEINKNTTKKHNLERSRKRGAREHLLGSFLTYLCSKNASKHRSEKLWRKTRQKTDN